MIGQTLGHYRILEKVAAGGMGVVYRAHDEQLEREVAVKVLPAGTLSDAAARRHFRHEATALAKLNHPHIETVYDFGTQDDIDFLVMEYVPGKTLADRLSVGALPEKEIIDLGIQIASALQQAHERGIVHRDLKPANIAITEKGYAKILDFGLAKLLRPVEEGTTEVFSDSNAMAGTLPYMPPEQLKGERVDGRADIYTIGAVLYEMSTGIRAFREEIASRLIDSILHQPVVIPRALNPRISGELETIILKCLDKDPDRRYQSAKELLVDLRRLQLSSSSVPMSPLARPHPPTRWKPIAFAMAGVLALGSALVASNVAGWRDRLLGWPRTPQIRSLAVLPFENLSGDPAQDYFADGMTEALITDLGQLQELRVISRTSVMQYKGAKKRLRQIARELNVERVMEGAVLKDKERVRITVKLINGMTEENIWARSYARDLKDVLALQDEVARAIAEEIPIRLDPKEVTRLASAPSVDPSAYEAYLKGRYFWNQRTREAALKGLGYFQQAVALDPTYALGYAGVADSYVILGVDQWLPPAEAYPRARDAALKALQLDNSLAEAHAALAEIELGNWHWEEAEREYRLTLKLSPGYAVAHQWYSTLLAKTGRFQEAITEAKLAAELDPLSPITNVNETQILLAARRFDEARAKALKTLELAPTFVFAHFYVGVLDMETQRLGEAIAELEESAKLSSSDDRIVGMLGYAYALAGRKAEARKILEDMILRSKHSYVPPYQIALVCVGLGQNDQAMQWLEKGYKDHDSEIPDVGAFPMFDPLRSDPRFQDLLHRMKLPEAAVPH